MSYDCTRRVGFYCIPLLGLSLFCAAENARAADLGSDEPRPVMRLAASFNWTGLTFGVTAGYAFNGHDAGYTFNDVPPEDVAMLPNGAALSNNGGLVGGSVGYDIQTNGVVVGLVGDLSWTDFGDKDETIFLGDSNIGIPPITFRTKYALDWISTLRGRIGIPFDQVLVYGTGGLAFGDVSMNSSVVIGDPPMGALTGATEETKVGWTLGGGVELALTEHLTATAEALYFDLGSVHLNAAAPPSLTTASMDVDQKVEGVIARAGLGYKF